jgi:hypothetical protein
MDWIWKNMGERVVKNSQLMKERQHSAIHLIFKEYKEGDYFYHRRIPKRFHKSKKDEKLHKLNAKLQFRWTGPFIVVKKVNPVLYEEDMHNVSTMVHAMNMRPLYIVKEGRLVVYYFLPPKLDISSIRCAYYAKLYASDAQINYFERIVG